MRWLAQFLVFLLSAALAIGHEDDIGDVHPRVTVENDGFAICFYNNESFELDKQPTFKTTLDRNGNVLIEREPIRAMPEIPLPGDLPEEMNGTGAMAPGPDAFYVFSNWVRDDRGNPLLQKWKDGKETRITLPWKETKVSWLNGASVTVAAYIVVGSQVGLESDQEGADSILRFYVFPRAPGGELDVREIGAPFRVYGLPRCSEVQTANGAAYIAWMGLDQNGEAGLFLTRLDLKTKSVDTIQVGPGHGNSDPSIGILGDKILIAHHRPARLFGYRGDGARIMTYCLPLPESIPE